MADPQPLAARLHRRLRPLPRLPPDGPVTLAAHCYTWRAPNVCEHAVRSMVLGLGPAASLTKVALQPFLCGLGTWVHVELVLLPH